MYTKRRDNKGRLLREGESQRPDGRYMYRYTNSTGERKVEYSWRLVDTDAHPKGKKKDISLREKEALIERDLMDGINIAGASIKFNELFERYLRSKKRLSANVRDTYKSLYTKHIKKSYIGNMQIKAITKNDIINIYESMSESGLSNGTIHNVHNNILYPALQLAVDNDWIRKNPTKDCLKEYPYDALNKRDALSEEEQKIFLEFLSKDNVYSKYLPIVILVMETALRRGEVLGLTWDDIDFKNKVIRINHQLHYYSLNGTYEFKIGKPKTESGNRVVPLSKSALFLLQQVKQKEYFNSVNSKVKIDGYTNFVFLNNQKNNVLIPRKFGDALTAACKKYNKREMESAEKDKREPKLLPMITPHILRHTSCTRMYEQGVDIKALQSVMGHKKVELLMNVYNHADSDRINEEFEKVKVVEAACLLG